MKAIAILFLLTVCLAKNFSYLSFTQTQVDNDFTVIANSDFNSALNSLQLVPSRRNNVGATFHVNLQSGNFVGDFVATGFVTQFTFEISAIVGLGGAGVAFVLQPNGAINCGTTGAGMGYGDYQNGQQGIFNSLVIEFDVYQDASMGDPNRNHVGVHSKGNNPNSSNENAVILGLVNTTIPAIQTGNGTKHTVDIEYQASLNTLEVILDGQLVLFSDNFTLSDWIELPSNGNSFIGLTSSTNTNDYFQLDILSWSFGELV